MSSVRRQATIMILAACLLDSLPPVVLAQTAPDSTSAVIDALRKGQNSDALRITQGLLRTDPHSYKVWTLQAVALERSDKPKEALAAYQHALGLEPDYLPALEGAAQLNYKAQSAQAVPLLRRIVSLQPSSPVAHAMLAVFEYRKSDYSAAAQDFEAAGDAVRSQPDALMTYSICLVHLNREPEAIARFQQLVALRPDDTVPRLDLALVQWKSGAGTDALATLQPLLDAHTTDSRALRLAAAIHEANNETPQAVDLLRTAIMANPEEPDNYVEFATLSFTHGSYSVGIDIVNLGLTKLPNSAALYMARGVLYGQNGDFEKAMASSTQAPRSQPPLKELHNLSAKITQKPSKTSSVRCTNIPRMPSPIICSRKHSPGPPLIPSKTTLQPA